MRLIDADKFQEKIKNHTLQVEIQKQDSETEKIRKVAQAIQDYTMRAISDAPTIDTETLPIMQELRANIAIQEKIIENHHNPFDTDKIVKLTLENANLKQQLSKVIAERDKVLEDLKLAAFSGICEVCKYYNQNISDCSCSRECFDSAEFEYRGFQEEKQNEKY